MGDMRKDVVGELLQHLRRIGALLWRGLAYQLLEVASLGVRGHRLVAHGVEVVDEQIDHLIAQRPHLIGSQFKPVPIHACTVHGGLVRSPIHDRTPVREGVRFVMTPHAAKGKRLLSTAAAPTRYYAAPASAV